MAKDLSLNGIWKLSRSVLKLCFVGSPGSSGIKAITTSDRNPRNALAANKVWNPNIPRPAASQWSTYSEPTYPTIMPKEPTNMLRKPKYRPRMFGGVSSDIHVFFNTRIMESVDPIINTVKSSHQTTLLDTKAMGIVGRRATNSLTVREAPETQ